MPRNHVWMRTDTPPTCKLTKGDKQSLQAQADQFVNECYRPTIKPPTPDQVGNYIVEDRTKWHDSYLQFIAKFACPGPDALFPSFEIAFAPLGCVGPNAWNLWTRRHNDQWMITDRRKTPAECFAEMRTNPWFLR